MRHDVLSKGTRQVQTQTDVFAALGFIVNEREVPIPAGPRFLLDANLVPAR